MRTRNLVWGLIFGVIGGALAYVVGRYVLPKEVQFLESEDEDAKHSLLKIVWKNGGESEFGSVKKVRQ